jgi:hypothetical protein
MESQPTREWLQREDSSSPAAALETTMLAGVIDAHAGCNAMMCGIPARLSKHQCLTQRPEKSAQ